VRTDLIKYLQADLRYNQLMRSSPAISKRFTTALKSRTKHRHEELKHRSEMEVAKEDA
jgi:hypothetical protein